MFERGWTRNRSECTKIGRVEALFAICTFTQCHSLSCNALHGRNATMYHCTCVCKDKDTGAWNRRCQSSDSWSVALIRSRGSFGMPFSRHKNEVWYSPKLHTLTSNVSQLFQAIILRLCCFEKPYVAFYLVKNERVLWHKVGFE